MQTSGAIHRVTLYALTTPPSPMLYREFDRCDDAMEWQAWAKRELPCLTRRSRR